MKIAIANVKNIIENIIDIPDDSAPENFGGVALPKGLWIGDSIIPLDEQKVSRIAQSKTDLANYLASHPIQWTDSEYYSITAEKQQQLTSKIMAATMAQTLSTDYNLTWNSTGEVCKTWTLQDLAALAFAIDARVTALVSYQQTQEVAMRDAATQEELDAVVVDYDSVKEASA